MSFRAGGVFGDEFWTQEDIDTVWVCDHAGCVARTQLAQGVSEARHLATTLGWVITDVEAYCPEHRGDHSLGRAPTGPSQVPAARQQHGFGAFADVVGIAYQAQLSTKDLIDLLMANLTQEQRGEARFYHQVLKQRLPADQEPHSSRALEWLANEGTSLVKPL